MSNSSQEVKPKFPSKEWFKVSKNRNMAIGICCAVVIGIVIAIMGIAGVFGNGDSNRQKHTVAFGNPVTIEGYQIAVDTTFDPLTVGRLGLNTASTGKTFIGIQVKIKVSANSKSPYNSLNNVEIKLEYDGTVYTHSYTASVGLYSDYNHGSNVVLTDLVAGTQYNLPFAFEVPASNFDMAKAYIYVETDTDEYRFYLTGTPSSDSIVNTTFGSMVTIDGYEIAIDSAFLPVTTKSLGLSSAATGKTFLGVQIKVKSVNAGKINSPYDDDGDIYIQLQYGNKTYDYAYTASTGLYSDFNHGDNVVLVNLTTGNQYNLPFAFEVPEDIEVSEAFVIIKNGTKTYKFALAA